MSDRIIITETADIVGDFRRNPVIKALFEYEIERCMDDVIEIVANPTVAMLEKQPTWLLLDDGLTTQADKTELWKAFRTLTCALSLRYNVMHLYLGDFLPYQYHRLLGDDIVLKELKGFY